jgi:hypothetical protein
LVSALHKPLSSADRAECIAELAQIVGWQQAIEGIGHFVIRAPAVGLPAINADIPTTRNPDKPHDWNAQIDRKFAAMSDEEYVASLRTSEIAVVQRDCETCAWWVEGDDRCTAPEDCQNESVWKAKNDCNPPEVA